MSPVTHQSSKQFTPKNESADLKEGGEVFHKDFRLWITVSADHISSIPGLYKKLKASSTTAHNMVLTLLLLSTNGYFTFEKVTF